MRIDLMHASMQYNDTNAQQRADADHVFGRARARDVWWITGTEANQAEDSANFKAGAEAHGYVYCHEGGDVWVAVDPARVRGNKIASHWVKVIPGAAHRHPERGVLRVSFNTEQLGLVTVLAAHLNLARGTGPEDNPKIMKEVSRQARRHGRGAKLVFYGGDQNISDRKEDTFLGGPLTSAWDELGRYEATHDKRTIDVIASYDRDGRVKAAYCRALDDTEMGLHTDHYPIEAGYDVTPLR